MGKRQLVSSPDEVIENIRNYNREVVQVSGLAARVGQHPAWYAVRDGSGSWLFGPSKFIGYKGADASDYLSSYDRKDGRETEPALSEWFEPVPLDSALGRELKDQFRKFAASLGKTPNKRWRVSVSRSEIGSEVPAFKPGGEVSIDLDRIAFDPDICGGRPHIRGTRVRVSDIVEMVASGASSDLIVADYPYLVKEDIAAALQYAASAVDHRVVWSR